METRRRFLWLAIGLLGSLSMVSRPALAAVDTVATDHPTASPAASELAAPSDSTATAQPRWLTGDRSKLSPMLLEIAAAWDAQQSTLEVLEQQLAAANDHAVALALQRQIEALHRQTELAILGIQARHARRAGFPEVAAQIEAAVAEMNAPAVRSAPVERVDPTARPAPSGQQR